MTQEWLAAVLPGSTISKKGHRGLGRPVQHGLGVRLGPERSHEPAQPRFLLRAHAAPRGVAQPLVRSTRSTPTGTTTCWPELTCLASTSRTVPTKQTWGSRRALELWPRLDVKLDVPLDLARAGALGGEDWWLTPFMDQADNQRVIAPTTPAGHWYSRALRSTTLFGHINDIQSDGNGREGLAHRVLCR